MMHSPRLRAPAILLCCAALSACSDDTATAGSATDGSSSGGSTTQQGSTSGATTAEPTTGEPTTAGTGTGDGTTGDGTTGDVTTGDGTTGTSSTGGTTEASTSSGTTEGGSSSTGAPCGPGQPGPDADGDTVPDECDICMAGDDLVDGDGDGVPDACDACLAGDDALDADGDTVPDACDKCPAGDDLADMDKDGLADKCDKCPTDPKNDQDNDNICDSMDICPLGPNDIDVDKDGKPDACDDHVLMTFPKGIGDYDVAADGALVVVRGEAGSVFVTCYNGDRSVRRAEFVAGSYDANQGLGPYPEIHMARVAQKVLVTWHDKTGGDANTRIAYSLLDNKCMPIVTGKTAIQVANAYFEFHNSAIDDNGNSVVSVSPSATYVNWVDANGVAKTQQQAFNINAVYGDHVAVNQKTGDGILAAQIHSGNGIYYRRFKADGSWVDPAAVQVSVNYHYWYDGFTVGMNDKDQFVFLWRSGGTTLDMRFFGADGKAVTSVQRQTIDFEGWNGGHCYDSFRMRHQEIPLRGDDFVLGEVYNWITPQQNRTTKHFQYTPAGALVTEKSTTTNLGEGLTIRIDQLGATYLRGPNGIEIVKSYP